MVCQPIKNKAGVGFKSHVGTRWKSGAQFCQLPHAHSSLNTKLSVSEVSHMFTLKTEFCFPILNCLIWIDIQ